MRYAHLNEAPETNAMSDASPDTQPQAVERQFALQRIYLKDVSFESPASPRVFTQPWQPQARIEVETRATRLRDDHYEVVILLTFTAQQDNKTVLLIEIQQAGVFRIVGIDEEAMPRVLHVTCPTMLFPYLRETVDSLSLKGGFPPVLLAPVDFATLHQNSLARQSTDPVEG
jgi:preprotein translocase subunit SecB